jgi:hypothetical protein
MKIMTKDIKLFGFAFWLHLFLIVIAYSSPFLFSWKLILIGVFVLMLQFIVLRQCILTTLQFGEEKYITFYTIYLEKLGLKFKRKNLYILMRYIMPFVVLLVSLIWQITLKRQPLIF